MGEFFSQINTLMMLKRTFVSTQDEIDLFPALQYFLEILFFFLYSLTPDQNIINISFTALDVCKLFGEGSMKNFLFKNYKTGTTVDLNLLKGVLTVVSRIFCYPMESDRTPILCQF